MKNVVINGHNAQLQEDEVVGYAEIVSLAGMPERKGLTVTYSGRVQQGSLFGSHRIIPEEGMVFNVANTSYA